MGYSHAPAGSRTTSTAAELVRFAQMHLNSGAAPDGEQVLSAASVAAMQQVGVTKPETSTGLAAQGLGWAIEDWDGKRVIGHNGGTIGQTSFLRAVPNDDLVVALLTNSATSARLWTDLARWLFEELAGLKMATPLQVPAKPPELPLARYQGTYERLGVRRVVAEEDGGLVMRTELIDVPEELRPGAPPPPLKLRAIDESRFGTWVSGANDVVVFMEFERGRPGYIFVGGRVARRKGRPSSARNAVDRRRPSRDKDRRR
jgi:Beta-lactamase